MTTISTITSEELNFIIFRYLQESGFTHAAFALGYEAGINKTRIDGNSIPPGALVTIVQKGLQYIELEANIDGGNTYGDDDFSHLQPLDIITKDVDELQRIIKEKKDKLLKERDVEKDSGRERERERQEKDREQDREKEKAEKDKEQEREREKDKQPERHIIDDHEAKTKVKTDQIGIYEGPEPMEITSTATSAPYEIPSSDVTILEGHSSEVFACAWSPTGSLLASGSGDSTARIWTIPDGPCGYSMQSRPPCVQVLKHFKGRLEKSKDVTTLDWNGEGSLLATGSYDGQARIWSKDGELKNTLTKHKGPIFSLKWNKKGDYLLSGSVDKTAIVWDTRTWEYKQQFEFHTAPTLDVDWRNNVSFATCSTDHMIYICKIGENRPIKAFAGHQGEVNAIKWDPTGSLLASCSDDSTAKIWSLKQDKCFHDFKAHEREIYTIKWSPTGPGTNNPNQQLLLASASFDSSIKLWDVELGRLVYSLNGHRQPVYAVAFSPNGQFLASGSLDQCLHIWSVKEGKLLKTYSGGGGIFEVCWNRVGTVQGNRKVLFGLHERFLKLEKECGKSGLAISFKDLGNGNEGENPLYSNGMEAIDGDGGTEVSPPKRRKKENAEKKNKAKKKKKKKKKNVTSESVVGSNGKIGNDATSANEDNGAESDDTKAISKSKKKKKKNLSDPAVESNREISDVAVEQNQGNANGDVMSNDDLLNFDESMISNLQKQFEKVAAEAGMASTATPVNIAVTRKRKRAKSTDKQSTLSNGESVTGKSGEKSSKKVRFSLKNNLVWKPQTPMPPQNLRLPPSATPRGSALKKGVPPGPIKESPATVKKIKAKGSSVKKARKSMKSVSPAVKRLRKLQSLSP